MAPKMLALKRSPFGKGVAVSRGVYHDIWITILKQLFLRLLAEWYPEFVAHGLQNKFAVILG